MFNKKVKSIPIDKYFQIIKNEYVTVQIIPTKSNKNNSTDAIASLINKMFLKLNNLIRLENKKLIIQTQMKASYYIHITKEEVQFYFILPKVHLIKFKSKFSEIWKNIEIKEVDCIPININECTKYQLRYKMNDALSLNVDKRNNDLLAANLSVLEILDTGESIGIFYNFVPTAEKESNYFKTTYKTAIEQYKNGDNLKKSKNIIDLGVVTVKFLINFIDDLISSILNDSKKSDNVFISAEKDLSNSTKRKAKSDICKTQVVVLSKSEEKERENQLGVAACNTFKSINDDNELVYKQISNKLNEYSPRLSNIDLLNTTVEECSNFISVPGREIIDSYNVIQHNKILERKIPKCLESGDIRIGTVKCKDTIQEAYYSIDNQISRLGRVLLGSMGAGKDYYMVNMAKDIIAANRGLIVIDYIDQCQLANNIKDVTPPDKLLEIDCSNINQLQSFVFNEHKINSNLDDYSKIAIAMQKSEQIQVLLDSINDDNTKLTPRMLRYLYAAGTVVFYLKENASFKDVIDVLTNPDKRERLINELNENAQSILVDELDDLRDLTKTTKSGVENYDSKIDGIIDRVSWLKTNMYTKMAYSKDSSSNIDFVDAINQGKVILIKIPEKQFNSRVIRNVIATFYLSKVWLAKQLGATEIKTELFVNEIHQSYNCQLLMENILVESRKFNLVPTLAMHYLSQCTSKCKNAILASGSSFILISGCDVKAFNELRTHFEKDGYDETDLVELDRYNALCLIKNEDTNYSSFVAKLPA
ncbi:hypothetical protein [Paraclostridium sordellii]|uniref:hypothetical protein n=1 Tax=Paraclostridium sordellii TaxID=1505 RepID=UPI0005DAAC1E|nr:hypothetical protein [Paeniclostridium sordellii]CEQ26746.1 Uncharacterised protein [[Clostridium] sordellii] [Paeniclostridium sordellii]